MVRSVSSARVSALTPPTSARVSRRNAPMAPGTVGMHSSDVEHPAVEVEADDVLEVLPAAEQAAAVADLGVAGDRADGRVGEGLRPAPHGPARTPCRRRRARAGRAAAAAMPVFRAAGLPALACRITRDVGQARAARRCRGAVGRPVVDHDDLQLGVVTGGQRPHRRAMPELLVVRRDDHRDRRAGRERSVGGAPGRPGPPLVASREDEQEERPEHRQHGQREQQQSSGRRRSRRRSAPGR